MQLVAHDSLAVTRGMGEDRADNLRPAAISPDENLAHLPPDPRGIGPSIDRLAPQLELLRTRRVAEDRVAGRIVRVQLQQLLALGLRGLVLVSVLPRLLARGDEQENREGRSIHGTTGLRSGHEESESRPGQVTNQVV